MAAILNPSSQLGFNRPLTRSITKYLSVTNPHEFPIAFKVKTTAPKLYVVRPNSGTVSPGESVEVSVILQAMKEEPSLNTRCKDKFLIQTTSLAGERELMSTADLWNPTDEDPASMVHQQKIRVAYLAPEGEAIPEDTEQPSMMSDTADLSRYQTIRELPSTSTSNGHAHPSAAEALSPPSPPERAASPGGDFIVAQEETTTTHILHDLDDEPEPEPPAPIVQPAVRAPTPPTQVPVPVPTSSLLAAASGVPPAHPPQPIETVIVPRAPAPAPAPAPAAAPAPAPAPVRAPEPVIVVAQPAHQAAPSTSTPGPVAEPIRPVLVAPEPSAIPAVTRTPAAPSRERETTRTSSTELDALMQRYSAALTEIGRLQAELNAASQAQQQQQQQQPVGVRRRTTTRVVSEDGETLADADSDAEGTTVGTMVGDRDEKMQVEGVPINVVAGIAIAVFLATYLFF